MNSTVIAVRDVPPLDHDEAMAVAETEDARLLDAVARLTPTDWSRPTDCPAWDVKAVLTHTLGMLERNADPGEAMRQNGAAAERTQATGEFWLDALTALQVEEHAHLEPAEVTKALKAAAPAALAGRAGAPAEIRASAFNPGPPFDEEWTFGYLLDIIHTRDTWMHRVDIARATGANVVLTADHDRRLVADVVAEWARRHGQAFTLVLDGPAGATFVTGDGGPRLELDAIDFCRVVSGRATGEGLLAHEVPF
jgi:uncharacterized protein (TIGR03083 family)